MPRKLIIHIGSHKTGTSSIQRALYANRAALQQQEFTLFCQKPDGSEKPGGNSSRWGKLVIGKDHSFQGRIRKGLPEALSRVGENVIISTEAFSWLFDAKKVGALQSRLTKYFDDIRIVAYIRRQDLHAVSHHQQGSKSNSRSGRLFFGSEPTALPSYKDYFQNYLNYNHRLGLWADAFGERNLVIRLFETDLLKNGDVVDDFFENAGLAKKKISSRKNESSGFEKTKVSKLLRQQDFSPAELEILTRYLDNTGKLLPARADAIKFYELFRESNVLLNKRFGLSTRKYLFNENFDQYPIEAGDQWDESSANKAIGHLLQGVKDLTRVEQNDLDVIRHCAEILATMDKDNSAMLHDVLEKLSWNNE